MSEVMETRARPGPKPDDRPWTGQEEERLREMRRVKMPFKEIARKLVRTREGCIAKWDRMSGRKAARKGDAPPPERRPISLGGPAWSRPERYQG